LKLTFRELVSLGVIGCLGQPARPCLVAQLPHMQAESDRADVFFFG